MMRGTVGGIYRRRRGGQDPRARKCVAGDCRVGVGRNGRRAARRGGGVTLVSSSTNGVQADSASFHGVVNRDGTTVQVHVRDLTSGARTW